MWCAGSSTPPAGDTFLRLVALACVMLFAAKHTWVLSLTIPPLVYVAIKKTGSHAFLFCHEVVTSVSCHCTIGSSMSTSTRVRDTITNVSERPLALLRYVVNIAVPHTLRNFVRFMFSSDQKLIMGLESAMDLLASIIVIVGVAIGLVLTGIFVVVQVSKCASC